MALIALCLGHLIGFRDTSSSPVKHVTSFFRHHLCQAMMSSCSRRPPHLLCFLEGDNFLLATIPLRDLASNNNLSSSLPKLNLRPTIQVGSLCTSTPRDRSFGMDAWSASQPNRSSASIAPSSTMHLEDDRNSGFLYWDDDDLGIQGYVL